MLNELLGKREYDPVFLLIFELRICQNRFLQSRVKKTIVFILFPVLGDHLYLPSQQN